MDNCIRKRRGLKGRVTRIENAITAQGSNPWDRRLVTGYQQQLEQLWTELLVVHEDAGLLCDDDETFMPHQHEYDQLASRIETAQLRFPEPQEEQPSGSGQTNGSAAASNETTVRLTKLELPTFSGSLHEWTSFHDLFTATINNNDRLAGAQKLQYLKASLRGEAAILLQSIQITDNNFNEAWEILKRRFDNRREIINSHLKRLFSQPTLTTEAPATLRKLIDISNETVRALRVLNVPVEHWDILLVYLVSEKLDTDSRRQWELTLQTTEVVKFEVFMSFLELRARALMTCAAPRPRSSAFQPESRPLPPPKLAYHHSSTTEETCRICSEQHEEQYCDELLHRSIEERRALIRDYALCYNCLSGHHLWRHCKAEGCKQCGGKHHTLLHEPRIQREEPDKEEQLIMASHHSQQDEAGHSDQVLLATALVRVQDVHGRDQLCRALLDSGSQATFVTEACAQRLGLPRQRRDVTVTGICSSGVNVERGSLQLKVSSRLQRGSDIHVNAFVLNKVTGILPSSPCDTTRWRHVPKTELADPEYHQPQQVDLLLGAGVFAHVLRHGLKRGPEGAPTAHRTTLGWLISGRVKSNFAAEKLTTAHGFTSSRKCAVRQQHLPFQSSAPAAYNSWAGTTGEPSSRRRSKPRSGTTARKKCPTQTSKVNSHVPPEDGGRGTKSSRWCASSKGCPA